MSVERETIKEQIANWVFINTTLDKHVTEDATLIGDLHMDDLDKIECIMNFESEYNIYITDDEYDTLLTIKDLIDIIFNKHQMH
jgi:acyl carrier protein